MVRGLFTAYTGMNNEQRRMDVLSNNLANAATVGYKAEGATNQSFDDMLAIKIKDSSELGIDRSIGDVSLGVKVGEVYTNFAQGSLRETGNTFDLAIDGQGFFAVNVVNKNGDSQTMYTRDGSFKMTAEGFLTDSEGNKLIGSGGFVQVPTNSASISIDSSGAIYADQQYIDTIQLVDFENYDYLAKRGTNLYQAVDGAQTKDAAGLIRQGYTEQSNVNSVSEMVKLITITRAYEANQKVLQAFDSTLQKACNDIGKVR
ncbi:flagellar basal-body rod protein FlgF [[Clostridium] polysaccharolyticum]|uniref:Flagellar basal-body rod protein FlgG n=1 Tax=[Clostridium] polysaccharolyticum TaxID=29364 RepID=A0A1I0FWU7_9FIRM|nr:flagellar basal-body rod protein FlgF [[Clostridium] polysaccharolyticum]SET62762.1 flagellar basal-body rod protein FlgG [[Clostridium] polysaccharolyticum]